MDLRTHLFNRREVVAIFLDVDASMLETDVALPTPADRAGKSTTQTPIRPPPPPGSQHTSPQSPGAIQNATTTQLLAEDDRYTPPSTRFEIVREALRSFVAQKERSVAHQAKLSFALYAVLTSDVVELLPPTPCTDKVVDGAFKRYLGKDGGGKFKELLSNVMQGRSPTKQNVVSVPSPDAGSVASGAASSSSGGFPFTGMAVVLRGIEAAMAATTESGGLVSLGPQVSLGAAERGSGQHSSFADSSPQASPSTAGRKQPSSMNGTAAAAGSSAPNPKAFLNIQGVFILSRDISAIPVGPAPADPRKAGEGPPPATDVWLDILTLNALPAPPTSASPETSAGATAAAQRSPERNNSKTPRSQVSSLPVVPIDVGCTLMDPVRFTGIQHRGLALGPSLTKLLATHAHGTKDFLTRPVFTVQLPPSSYGTAHTAVGALDSVGWASPRPASDNFAGSRAPPPPLDLAPGPHSTKPPSPLSPTIAPIPAHRRSKTEGSPPAAGHTGLPPLQRERRTPQLAAPLHARVTSAGSTHAPVPSAAAPVPVAHPVGVVSGGGAATSTRPQHYVRGTVVAISNGETNAGVNGSARRKASATGPEASPAEPQPASRTSSTPIPPPGSLGALRSPLSLPSITGRSPNTTTAQLNGRNHSLLGKRQGLHLRGATQCDSNSSSISNREYGSNHLREVSDASSGFLDEGIGSYTLRSPAYPSDSLRGSRNETLGGNVGDEDLGDFPAAKATVERGHRFERRPRAESTGSAIKRRRQLVQQQRDQQLLQQRGSSVEATPSSANDMTAPIPSKSSATSSRVNRTAGL